MTDQLRECPRFGDLFDNTAAGDKNPRKRAMFVRTLRRTGRLNPGVWWQMTDGNGDFWEQQPDHLVRVDNTRPAAVASHAEAFTYGHCAEKSRPGGCQKHNLQCGYPDCDRRPVAHPHRTTDNLNEPSGDSGELARDAARYRWLRQPNAIRREAHIAVLTEGGGYVATEEMADRAIDKAMERSNGMD